MRANLNPSRCSSATQAGSPFPAPRPLSPVVMLPLEPLFPPPRWRACSEQKRKGKGKRRKKKKRQEKKGEEQRRGQGQEREKRTIHHSGITSIMPGMGHTQRCPPAQ